MTTKSSAETSPSLTPPPSEPRHGDTKQFRSTEVSRQKISLASYNPRQIDPVSLAKLQEGIAKFGLVEPLVWNERTGNLVGGHQRLGILDRQHGNTDYTVPVSVVDLDETSERELNIFLNNTTAQGDFDMAKLENIFLKDGVSPFKAGFDIIDLQSMFVTDSIVDMLQQFKPELLAPDFATIPGTPPPDAIQQAALDIMEIKAARKSHKSGNREDLRSDHIVVMVFDTPWDAGDFLEKLGMESHLPFFLAADMLKAMGREDLIPVAPPEPTPTLDNPQATE